MMNQAEFNKMMNKSDEFRAFLIERCPSNLTPIKRVKFNKKSISVVLDKELRGFDFNNFFNERNLYKLILSYLRAFINERNINYTNDFDVLEYYYPKLNINYK